LGSDRFRHDNRLLDDLFYISFFPVKTIVALEARA
jgi:hypothetical protein